VESGVASRSSGCRWSKSGCCGPMGNPSTPSRCG
jgi:hypothetical protein